MHRTNAFLMILTVGYKTDWHKGNSEPWQRTLLKAFAIIYTFLFDPDEKVHTASLNITKLKCIWLPRLLAQEQ